MLFFHHFLFFEKTKLIVQLKPSRTDPNKTDKLDPTPTNLFILWFYALVPISLKCLYLFTCSWWFPHSFEWKNLSSKANYYRGCSSEISCGSVGFLWGSLVWMWVLVEGYFCSCSFVIKCQLKYFAINSLACGYLSPILFSIGLAALLFNWNWFLIKEKYFLQTLSQVVFRRLDDESYMFERRPQLLHRLQVC